MAVDSHVTGTSFLVRSVRRTMSRSRHENPVFLSMRDTPARLARGGSAEAPQGDVETPPPTVEAKERNSQHVEAVPQTSETTSSKNRDTNDTKQVNTSSNKFQSSGDEHADKPAESTIEGESPMCEIKRPKRGPTAHILSMSRTVEYTERVSRTVAYTEGGRKKDGKCRTAKRADRASHVGGADGADDAQCRYQAVEGTANHAVEGTANHAVDGTANQAVGGTASSSQVPSVSESNVETPKQTETRVGVQAKAGPRAVQVEAANQKTETRVGVQVTRWAESSSRGNCD